MHRRPSSTWRKERRRDPIQIEALDMSAARVHSSTSSINRPSVIVPTIAPAAPQSLKKLANTATELLTGN